MIILGLDPGTTRIGYGLVQRGSPPALLGCGILNVQGAERGARLGEAAAHLRNLLMRHKPSLVAIEKLFFVQNQKTGLAVSEMRGALLLELNNARVPVVEYTPKEVKKATTGDGGADKRAVAKMVKATLHVDKIPGPDDVTDALAIALAALYDIRLREGYRV